MATARNSSRETEIKLVMRSAAAARRLLRGARFLRVKTRTFEANLVLDTAGLDLRKSGSLLRVRHAAGQVILTYKGTARAARHKSREELEVEASDGALLQRIFERLGFRVVFRYDKYRSEYRGHGAGLVTLDETPIGVYLELEGAPRWIDQTARRLGFTAKDYITASYGSLYLQWCRQRGVRAGNMVF